MDLIKFITRQRMTSTSILSLLNGRQKYFVDKLSQMTIRDSSDPSEAASDKENDPLRSARDTFNPKQHTHAMLQSEDIVDKRIIEMYRLRKATEIL